MSFLTDNFIANMYGPYFLIFYSVIIGILFIIILNSHKFPDKSHYNDTPKIPSSPDPYAISYLCQGAKETIKIVIFSLLERGYLIASSSKQNIKQKTTHPPLDNLTTLERNIFELFPNSKPIEYVVDNDIIHKQVENECKKIKFLEENTDLFQSKYDEIKFNILKYIFSGIIFFLGLYKLYIAYIKGHHNVIFLTILGITGIVIMLRLQFRPKLTLKGEKLTNELKTVFLPKYHQGISGTSSFNQILLAGIFGFSILHTKGYSFLENYNRTKFSSPYSIGCSTGCGSSCSGGSSCGGGGGCGGGCGGCGS